MWLSSPVFETYIDKLRPVWSLFSCNLGVDLGTSAIRVYARGKGVVVNEPSAVAINVNTGQVEGFGISAQEMVGQMSAKATVVKPVKAGVISDYELTAKMLRHFMQKAHKGKPLAYPVIVIGVPSRITSVEKRAVIESAHRAHAREVYLVEQIIMAALGAGIPVSVPRGHMIVDLGGGTTHVAVISMGEVVCSHSARVAGDQMDQAIVNYIKQKYGLLTGVRSAERIKIELGSAYPLAERHTLEIKGRYQGEGAFTTIRLDDGEVREVLRDCVSAIVSAVRTTLEQTPPELSVDISDCGIVLTGGGALLKGLDTCIRNEIGLPVFIADNPSCSAVLGIGKVLSDSNLLRKLSLPFDSDSGSEVAA